MEIEKAKPDFRPISIVLKTPEEVELILEILKQLIRVGFPYEGSWAFIGKRFTLDQVIYLIEGIEECKA